MKINQHIFFTGLAAVFILGAAIWGTFKPGFQPMFLTFCSSMLALSGVSHLNSIVSTLNGAVDGSQPPQS